MKASIYFSLLIPFFFACQASTDSTKAEGKYAQAQQVFDEAIEVHDEVMPRMDEIMRLKSLLKERIDSLQQQQDTDQDSLLHMQEMVQQLDEADEAMMQWMRGMQKVPDPEATASAEGGEMAAADTSGMLQIQQEQKSAIEAVKLQMESSITEARTYLQLPG